VAVHCVSLGPRRRHTTSAEEERNCTLLKISQQVEWHNYEQPRMELEADNLEYCQQGCFAWWASAFECFFECLGAWVPGRAGGVWVGCVF
jgi:hypothetical protein